MYIVDYSPDRFEDLRKAVERMQRGRALAIPDFVDHYYYDNEWGQLWLVLAEDDDRTILGTVGIESIPFAVGDDIIKVAFGSNFHALAKGSGGLMFLKWTRANEHCMTYNSSGDTRRLTDAMQWKSLGGVVTLAYNPPLSDLEDTRSPVDLAKRMVKKALRQPPLASVVERKAGDLFQTGVTIEAFTELNADRLDFKSPFDLRLAPDAEFLSWRYDSRWSSFRYRFFSIMRSDELRGLIILHFAPDRTIVAHADGENPKELAEGILMALAATEGPDSFHLATSVPEIADLCRAAGFKSNPEESRLFFSPEFPIESVSAPLINFGMGDNDLRPEFVSIPDV